MSVCEGCAGVVEMIGRTLVHMSIEGTIMSEGYVYKDSVCYGKCVTLFKDGSLFGIDMLGQLISGKDLEGFRVVSEEGFEALNSDRSGWF